MKVVNFYMSRDFEIINEWLGKRELPKWDKFFIPKFGLMAYDGRDRVCAGFMRICEGNVGLFDSLVSDPAIHKDVRSEAVDLIIDSVVKEGKKMGLLSIIGLTVIPSLMERITKKHGFFKSESAVMVLNFNLKSVEGVK